MYSLIPQWFITLVAFWFGSMVGSFLNVCIHRMPRGDSIVTPRSRCYSCGKMIPWYDNIPLLTYILLGGKCRNCKAPFSIRYWLVELLTALFFVAIWNRFPPAEAVVYSIFISGLIVATFIDFEHYIIPNEITWGGIWVGIVCCGIVPSMQHETLHLKGALWSLAGAAAGFGTLWGVVELGKLAFGVKKLEFPEPTQITLKSKGIEIGNESEVWEEIFSRDTDILKFDATNIQMGDKRWDKALVQVDWQKVRIENETFTLENLVDVKATTQAMFIPREAMGFGDVKFLGAIGAFLGIKAILFVIMLSSLVGSVVGLTFICIGKKEWGAKLPYGPYLALAAIIWVFGGSKWVELYLQGFGR